VARLFQLIGSCSRLERRIDLRLAPSRGNLELCQTVTVLRDGAHVATRPIGELQHDDLVQMMVGRPVEPEPRSPLSHSPERCGSDVAGCRLLKVI